MPDRQFLRQRGAKNIAVDFTALSEPLSIYLMSIIFCMFLAIGWYKGDIGFIILSVIIFISNLYWRFQINKHHADEVWETPDGFIIIINNDYEEIRFCDIKKVEYKFRYLIDSRNYIVEFYFKQPNKFGRKIFFVTWEDACNYNQESQIFRIKNQATTDYIHHLQEKIKQASDNQSISEE
ncbi:Uncharacterised protein [Moraxella cuniculi]|uniref:Uncharacterized protein n=2 Tax=Moraxella cuniculi TaxID=34061 RepID=A0A3S4QQJ8_9GAMM|nr:Uncharacterised protein [Moraxella cuniculi]